MAHIKNKILVLFAHPAFHKSKVHSVLVDEIKDVEGITLHNLYEHYPDFFIDIKREQKLLLEHEIIVWQHPFYWYSAPAMVKEWIDLVLEHGFAYGKNGNELAGKTVFSAISTGGSQEVYCSKGRNRFTIREFMVPFQQTAALCKMKYLPPFVAHGTHTLSTDVIKKLAIDYKTLLINLRDGIFDEVELEKAFYLNHLIS